jgi:ArsR family transcriptional regulator
MTDLANQAEQAFQAAEILKAVAHPLRLQIIAILCEQDVCVGELAERLGAKQPIVSQQLRILRMRGLADTKRKDGNSVYRLAQPHLKQLIRCMNKCVACT